MEKHDSLWRKTPRKGKKGFSLTEIVIVIVVIAILVLAIVFGASAAIKKAQMSRAISDLHNFDVSIQNYMGFKRDPVKLTNLSPKGNFDKVLEGVNPFLPKGYSVEPVTLPTSGNVYSSVSSLNIYASEKKDPWDNPYYVLLEAEERNAGCTEYYFTVVSAGPNSQADIGGPVDKDDIFLLVQYSNGAVTSHTYSMWKDKKDTTGTPLTAGVTSLSSLSGTSNPRNEGSAASGTPGGTGAPGGSTGGLPGTDRPGTGGSTGGGGTGGPTGHTHSWGDWTNVNETTHKRTCSGDSSHVETGTHTWDDGVITTQPTTTPGEKIYTCTVCGGSKRESLPPVAAPTGYLTFSSPSTFQISVANPGWTSGGGKIEYSTDTTTWTTWDGTAISASSGGSNYTLYLRGTENKVIAGSDSGENKWSITGSNVKCSGNIETLLDYVTVMAGNHPVMSEYCYTGMFYGCTSLTTAPELPATALAEDCYDSMFAGCTNLNSAPQLPATTLADLCYFGMFIGCTSLTTAPELPATTLAYWCYGSMFDGCTNLATAPELPATTLADSCYNLMFRGCTSLTTAPALPATTLAKGCYDSMFYGCRSLTTAPALPATTLAGSCYYEMFYGCRSLTSAPALPATTLAGSCYFGMFWDCTSLTSAPALPATTLAGSCYTAMFQGCTSLTSAPELPATTLAYWCYGAMFACCTSLTTAPALPATTLSQRCYFGMFSRCTSLTTAPELPATTLASECYSSMFSGCTSLKLSKTQSSEYTTAYRVPKSGTGVTATYTLDNMFYGTGGPFTGTPAINTTYYLHSSNSVVG